MKIAVLLLTGIFFFISGSSSKIFSKDKISSGNKYDVKNIPANLSKDAGAVVREDLKRFEVDGESKAVEKIKYVVTIFKKSKQDEGKIYLWYDKFSDVEDLEGKIYDADGNEVRELEDSDIKDYPAFSNYSLYEDNRIKIAELYYDKFPYTVEFDYEKSHDGFISWPSWSSRASVDPVEISSFEVSVPGDDSLRYWCSQDSVKPSISFDDGKKNYTWEAVNLPKLPEDAVENALEDAAVVVRIAPGKFDFDGFVGDMSSWKSLGKWGYDLTIGKNELPDSAAANIKAMVKDEKDAHQKIRTLYKYMQSRTRYVSVQLGIGGWQPFDASYVNERGYGDCKALSNYMISILKQAGITAYAVWIRSGSHRYNFIKEFPSDQFNHVIVAVPLKKDTVWLECTSQTMQCGRLGWFTENRNALMLTPEGGVVVRTPSSLPEQNMQQRKAKVNLNSFGWADIDVTTSWKGDQQDRVRESVLESSPEETKRWVLSLISAPNLKLKNYSFEGVMEHNPEVSLKLDAELKNYATLSGKRIFFKPNLMERRTYVPPDVENRLSPVRFNYPYYDVDSVNYTLPEGYAIEFLPNEVNIESSFGSFISITEKISGKEILFVRQLKVKVYSIPAENYSEYKDFFSNVVKADRAQVVLVEK